MRTQHHDLDGWWVATAAELGGVRLPAEALLDLPLRLSNDEFAFGTDSGRIVVNRHAHPTTMDIILMHGPNASRVVPAIVDRAGSTLRLCCDLSGARRPSGFVAPAGTRLFLATYRRVTIIAHGASTAPASTVFATARSRARREA